MKDWHDNARFVFLGRNGFRSRFNGSTSSGTLISSDGTKTEYKAGACFLVALSADIPHFLGQGYSAFAPRLCTFLGGRYFGRQRIIGRGFEPGWYSLFRGLEIGLDGTKRPRGPLYVPAAQAFHSIKFCEEFELVPLVRASSHVEDAFENIAIPIKA